LSSNERKAVQKGPPKLFCRAPISEASLASLGTASLITSFGKASPGRPLACARGDKKGARGDIFHCVLQRHVSAEGPLACARGDKRGARGDKKVGSGWTKTVGVRWHWSAFAKGIRLSYFYLNFYLTNLILYSNKN
jgi:hypothetical protein